MHGYVFAPCIVYGKGEGFGNIISNQTVMVVKAGRALRRVHKVDEGRPVRVCSSHENHMLCELTDLCPRPGQYAISSTTPACTLRFSARSSTARTQAMAKTVISSPPQGAWLGMTCTWPSPPLWQSADLWMTIRLSLRIGKLSSVWETL